METEEEDPKEEPIKEIKEVKSSSLLTWEPAVIVGCNRLVIEHPFDTVVDDCYSLISEILEFFELCNSVFPLKVSLTYFLE